MPEQRTTPSVQSVIVERLEHIRSELEQITKRLDTFIESSSQFRIDYEIRHAELSAKTNAAHTRLDDQAKDLAVLKAVSAEQQKSIGSLNIYAKMLGFVAGILGSSVIVFLWSIITHQVTLAVP